MHACTLSHFSRVQLCVTLLTAALQVPLSIGFSRQEYRSGLPFPLQKKVNTHPFIFLFGKGENVQYWLSSPKIKEMWWEKNCLWNLFVYICKPGRLGSFLWHSLDYLGLLKPQRLAQWWDQCKDERKFSQVYSQRYCFPFPSSPAQHWGPRPVKMAEEMGRRAQCNCIYQASRAASLTLAAAAAAKSLQSCPALCDPIHGSPPGSPVPGILQAKTLEWVATSFSIRRCNPNPREM